MLQIKNISKTYKTGNFIQKALDEVVKWLDKGFDAKIVWLTNSVYGDEYDYENDFEPGEAIALKFKGYWLVREI